MPIGYGNLGRYQALHFLKTQRCSAELIEAVRRASSKWFSTCGSTKSLLIALLFFKLCMGVVLRENECTSFKRPVSVFS